MKKIAHVLFSRMVLMILLILLEAAFIYTALTYVPAELLNDLETVLRLFSLVVVLLIVSYSRHLSSDLMWIVLILIAPAGGILVWLFLEVLDRFSSRIYKELQQETSSAKKYYLQSPEIQKKAFQDEDLAGQYRFISSSAGFPIYQNTGFRYYGLGELGWKPMLEDLRNAKEFIFLEYFIIEPGVMWDSIHEILKQKASEGVTVRVMYDDMGSLNTLPGNYWKKLRQEGIEAVAFNRVHPLLNGIMNHRDHRKIMVIDGVTAYSGGINLADEYINVKHIHGHWKDNVIRITGEAVWSYTVLFLTNWNAYTHEDSDYTLWKREAVKGEPDGFIAPYGDTPLDFQLTGQDVYLNILNHARHYCYIFTPYLIIDTDMMNSLILAAKRGVDVRIITPGIADKKIIWRITRSYYPNLIQEGVKIYEYTPGFDHAKVFVSDDEVATVGTINLDYRSLYLHFENGTALFHSAEINAIKADFLEAQKASHLVTMEEGRMGIFRTFFYLVLRIFAPMM
ncbi:MAG: cardiolipin synthase [Solobacterium sp.]|jgi:cardiolipin synthase|nr:cardiolipin synthase [Solobacterium sp.]MDY3233003.1 cardiolipin synthase [Erysipelotrichaceae bacterium]